MKTVTILLTRYSDLIADILGGVFGDKYSHASISIDGKEEIFYSFNMKGFAVETPKTRTPRARRPGSVCIRMDVPDETYRMIEEEINHFIEHREKYAYSKLGVVLCILHIPHKFKNQYFCSQFVTEILAKAGAVKPKRRASLYRPNQLLNGIEYMFSPKQFAYDMI